MIIKNKFEENVGLFGGAVSINSPNFAALYDPDEYTAETAVNHLPENRPYVIFSENDFNKNMAYMSGNAVFMQGTKRIDRPLEACTTSALVEKNNFYGNFGFKNSDGGAFSLVCNDVSDRNREDFLKSSGR